MKSPCQRKWDSGNTVIGTQCQIHLTAVSHTLSLNSSPMNLMFPRDLWRALKSASSNTSFRCFLSSSYNRAANNVMACVPEHFISFLNYTNIRMVWWRTPLSSNYTFLHLCRLLYFHRTLVPFLLNACSCICRMPVSASMRTGVGQKLYCDT